MYINKCPNVVFVFCFFSVCRHLLYKLHIHFTFSFPSLFISGWKSTWLFFFPMCTRPFVVVDQLITSKIIFYLLKKNKKNEVALILLIYSFDWDENPTVNIWVIFQVLKIKEDFLVHQLIRLFVKCCCCVLQVNRKVVT